MSEVLRAEDTRLRRPVAIKLLQDDGNPRSVARFEQEAQILARLHHPNVVIVFDTGVDDGERFIVMELVDGPTLRELLDQQGRLEPERAAAIGSGVASALGFAHGLDVVHRDVKPSNVLLPTEGAVKLADMGIASLLSPEALTMTLRTLGTVRYTSPEQARGTPVDGRSDLYSLGCVLFEMLTGRTPFEGNLGALSYAHAYTPAPRLRSANPEVPAAMDELVAAMLEKDPADRPQTGEEVQRSLAAAMTPTAVEQTALLEPASRHPTDLTAGAETEVMEPVPPPPPPKPRLLSGERRRRGAWVQPMGFFALGALIAVILLIALIALLASAGR